MKFVVGISDLVEIGVTPLLLINESGQFIAPASLCSAGSVTATFNNGTVPPAGTAVPTTGAFGAGFNNCQEAGTNFVYNGNGAATYSFTSLSNIDVAVNGNVSSLMATLRLRETGVGAVRDITGNGRVDIAFNDSVTGATVVQDFAVAPFGASLLNSTLGATATYTNGTGGLRVAFQGNAVTAVRYSAATLVYTVAGVEYSANGTVDIGFSPQGTFTGASGQITVSSNGATVGRLIADNAGVLVIEVNGQQFPVSSARPPIKLKR
jgi:hypothetical protein